MKKRLFLLAIVFASMLRSHSAVSQVPASEVPLLTDVDVRGKTPLELLLEMADIARTPIGIAVSKPSIYTQRISSKGLKCSFIDCVHRILLDAPEYSISESHGVVNIAVSADMLNNSLLNFTFSRFRTFAPSNATRVSADLWGNLQLSLNPKRTGYGGVLRVPSNDDVKLAPFDGRDVTLRDVLNSIVHKQGQMAWVSWPPPDPLVDAPEYELWNLVYFRRSADHTKLCCVYPPPKLANFPEDTKGRLLP